MLKEDHNSSIAAMRKNLRLSMPNGPLSMKAPSRKRELNVIYFVDSSSTRSFKLSLTKARILLALFVGVMIWAFSSVWILYSHRQERAELRGRVSHLLSTIFDYQTQYNLVYEDAYPGGIIAQKNTTTTVAASESTATPTNLKPENGGVSLSAKSIENVTKPAQPAATDVVKIEKANQVAAVEIEEPSFQEQGSKLTVNFAIKNLNTDQRATGYVWAVARLRSKEGSESFLVQPPGVEVDATGKSRYPLRSTKFNIMRFKPVSVDFEKPNGFSGSFVETKIYVMDQNNKQQEYRFPVNITTPPVVAKPVAVKAKAPEPPKVDIPVDQPLPADIGGSNILAPESIDDLVE